VIPEVAFYLELAGGDDHDERKESFHRWSSRVVANLTGQ
jgi:hypothetical protein